MSLVCHTCPRWTHVRGKHPNTGQEIDEWNCSDAIIPTFLLEIAMQVRQGAAATESFRNEVTRRADAARVSERLPNEPQIMIEGH